MEHNNRHNVGTPGMHRPYKGAVGLLVPGGQDQWSFVATRATHTYYRGLGCTRLQTWLDTDNIAGVGLQLAFELVARFYFQYYHY